MSPSCPVLLQQVTCVLELLLLRTTDESALHCFKRELESQHSRSALHPSPFSDKYLLKVSPPCVLARGLRGVLLPPVACLSSWCCNRGSSCLDRSRVLEIIHFRSKTLFSEASLTVEQSIVWTDFHTSVSAAPRHSCVVRARLKVP